MTQNEKDLLLRDLCARLPYGVICADIHAPNIFTNKWDVIAIDRTYGNEFSQVCISNCEETYGYKIPIERIKPYLLPLSSMSEEQKEEYKDLLDNQYSFDANGNIFTLQDFYCKYHLDFRGLIDKRCAIDATGLNIY